MENKMTHWEGFYVPPERILGDEVNFPPDEARHLAFVLRKKRNDRVWVVDGKGWAHEVELNFLTRREAKGRILRSEQNKGESRMDVTLAAGVLKGERFDWLVEKSVELGVRSIIPFLSEGTVVKPNAPRVRRWKNIAIAAMKQSGRSVLPDVDEIRNLEHVLKGSSSYGLRIAAHPGPGSAPLPEALSQFSGRTARTILLVGPEGGFVRDEVESLKKNDFVLVSLGPRRLRAETAGVALVSGFMMMDLQTGLTKKS